MPIAGIIVVEDDDASRAIDRCVHYLGTATSRIADGIKTEPGDMFEIEAPGFGRPLRNTLARGTASNAAVAVRAL